MNTMSQKTQQHSNPNVKNAHAKIYEIIANYYFEQKLGTSETKVIIQLLQLVYL